MYYRIYVHTYIYIYVYVWIAKPTAYSSECCSPLEAQDATPSPWSGTEGATQAQTGAMQLSDRGGGSRTMATLRETCENLFGSSRLERVQLPGRHVGPGFAPLCASRHCELSLGNLAPSNNPQDPILGKSSAIHAKHSLESRHVIKSSSQPTPHAGSMVHVLVRQIEPRSVNLQIFILCYII